MYPNYFSLEEILDNLYQQLIKEGLDKTAEMISMTEEMLLFERNKK
jgi:hypothetical protein